MVRPEAVITELYKADTGNRETTKYSYTLIKWLLVAKQFLFEQNWIARESQKWLNLCVVSYSWSSHLTWGVCGGVHT